MPLWIRATRPAQSRCGCALGQSRDGLSDLAHTLFQRDPTLMHDRDAPGVVAPIFELPQSVQHGVRGSSIGVHRSADVPEDSAHGMSLLFRGRTRATAL